MTVGSHRTQKSDASLKGFRVPEDWPALPNNVDKTRMIPSIDGTKRHFRIEDEIIHPQTNSNRKIIVFQKMRFVEEDRVEFRLGYYMIGVKPRAKGRWVWGQFCLLLPEEDLMAILNEARRRSWFQPEGADDVLQRA